MDERMQFVARRLAGEPMAELCREFGISRKTGYKISGHMPMNEEPGKFLLSLVRYARPIADRAVDTLPAP